MHWWPRHTPRIGVVEPKRRTTSVEIPASAGDRGPGERLMWLGASAATCARVTASLRHTTASPPSLTYRARLCMHEGVVVVYEEDHPLVASAAIMPLALSSVSRYLSSGSESTMIPPPALKYTRPAPATAVRMAMLLSEHPVTLQ